MQLRTRRLILRQARITDGTDLVEILNDRIVTRYTAHIPHPYTLKDARSFLKECIKKDLHPKFDNHDFRIVLRKKNKVIGGIRIFKSDRFTGKAEIGYVLGKNYWRQGYGTEALRALVKYAFSKLNLQRLEAAIYKENLASQALVKKLGFKKEGLRCRASRSLATGKLHDVAIYALLKAGKIK
jgi:ribosomal-protein-alanine N-acetyltransferase